MKIRRTLATAVAAAVTTPVVLLSAAPAFADTKPAGSAAREQRKPTIEELRRAVAEAKAKGDAADVIAQQRLDELTDLETGKGPLNDAVTKAEDKAAQASGEQANAEEAVRVAQAKLDAATDDAARAEAQQALDAAKEKAAAAATAKKAADKAVEQAEKALATAISEATRTSEAAAKAAADAWKAYYEAKAALAAAEAGDPCVAGFSLSVLMQGAGETKAGGSEVSTLRLTNEGATTLTKVRPIVTVSAFGKDHESIDRYLTLEWSTNGTWQKYDRVKGIPDVGSLAPKAHKDVRVRLSIDPGAPDGEGAFVYGADYRNPDGSCGKTQDLDVSAFRISAKKGGEPGTGGSTSGSTTGTGAGTTGGNGNTTQQGGKSTTPVTTGTTGSTTGGKLAATGAGSSTMPIALTGAAAVALGAGAMVVVRRRKAGADA
ncbi:LPXTG cell wall anchor domain-containing protein [Streptomyces roseicoloratus]|uniref:LPXTG cell wall anchor domain-containing protein n=1 Tax=Streptomyces roseicoloratus TaxID=2508722 RepID=UPI001009C80B|nr:LPXTG cell wall anchor domain-containing protein [Streptomyces roseicoloratus]